MSSRQMFGVLLTVLAVSASAWPAGQVAQNPGAPQVPPVGTGFIAGQVVELPSNRPVPETTVMIFGRGAVPPGGRGGVGTSNVVISDAQGRFYFANLPPGIYTVQANRPGFAGYTPSSPTMFELGAGERVMNATVLIRRLASLAGTLRDPAGDPIVGTDVIAFRRTITNGRPALQQAGRMKSDDRGAYRLGSLVPGDYVVCACTRDPNPFDGLLLTTLASQPLHLMSVAARALTVGADVVSLDNTLRTYPPTFHPNSATVARAARITLTPGDEKTGVDISVDLVRATRVSGRVLGAQSPVQASTLRLVPAADSDAGIDLVQIAPMLVQADGRFDFASVPPGQYRLMVTHRETGATTGGPSGLAMGFVGSRGASPPPAPVAMAGPGVTPLPTLWANEPIAVGDGGVSGLVVTLHQALTVTGRVEYLGAAPQPPAQMFNRATVSMQPVVVNAGFPFAGFPFFGTGRMAADASFSVPGVVPGKYILTATPLPGFPNLKSIVVGGVDVTDLPFEVINKDISEVVITFVETPLGSVTITTPSMSGQAPPADASVLIFPADRKFWTEPAAARRRFRSMLLPPNGTATTPELPAGDYFVLVVSGQDAADWMEPTRLDTLSRRAQRITVNDGGKTSVEVRR